MVVITNLQHALHSLLLDVYQAIVGIIKQIKNAIGYYQEKDLQIQSLNGSFSLLCNVRMDGDQVVVLNISTSSCVDSSTRLVTFKDFFFWLGKSSFGPYSRTSLLFVHYRSSLY
ncbi:unnamed protein product [Absidia cylindrospora]